MIPVATHAVTVEHPSAVDADPDEAAAAPAVVARGVPATIASPSGADLIAGGQQDVVDAVLTIGTTPALSRLDTIVDDATGDRYRVVWTRARPGLGLDHQTAGLRIVSGGSS